MANISTYVANNTCYLELYNLTDSVAIANSTITTTSISPIWVASANLLNDLPDKDIDLTVKLWTEKEGNAVNFTSANIYINF
jgi:hypothetical protein